MPAKVTQPEGEGVAVEVVGVCAGDDASVEEVDGEKLAVVAVAEEEPAEAETEAFVNEGAADTDAEMDVANVADNDWYAVRVEGGDATNSDSVVDDVVAAVAVVGEEVAAAVVAAAAAAEEGVEAEGAGADAGAGARVENGSAPVEAAAAEPEGWDGWGEKGVAEAAVGDGAVLMRQTRFQGQSVQAVGLVRSSHVGVAAAAAESGFVVPHVAVEVAAAVVVVGVEAAELVYSEFPD
ncbi:hypothetical protein EST38_g7723 [Candolleomyces aberdarensis]|uniref:Uncharacterized protein n=1 Tax=Candolleomyces aberdarensis TaxID=2316362 RepID=A0A4Q2DG87_9AGAR|nr:hypothetical protein EST38_g7723 [Candolleomyces aberdarensis]